MRSSSDMESHYRMSGPVEQEEEAKGIPRQQTLNEEPIMEADLSAPTALADTMSIRGDFSKLQFMMHQTEQNENFEVDNYEAIDNQNNNQI